MKKILLLVFPLLMLSFPSAVAALDPAPTLLKCPDSPAVYETAYDGVKRVFKNEDVFFSWHQDFRSVLTVSCAELNAIPLGPPMTYGLGTLLKWADSPRVYEVTFIGHIEHIPDEETAKAKFGNGWRKGIRILDQENQNLYTQSEGQTWSTFSYPGDAEHNPGSYPEEQPVEFQFGYPAKKAVTGPSYCYTSQCLSLGFMFGVKGERMNEADPNIILNDAAIVFVSKEYEAQIREGFGNGFQKTYGSHSGTLYTFYSPFTIDTATGPNSLIGLSSHEPVDDVFLFKNDEFFIIAVKYFDGFTHEEWMGFLQSIVVQNVQK